MSAIQHHINTLSARRTNANGRLTKLVVFLCAVIAALLADRFMQTAALNKSIQNDRPDPYVLVPDQNAGSFSAVTRLEDINLKTLEAAAFTEVTRYIQEYERYDLHNQREYWDAVSLKSSPDVFKKYAWRFNAKNPHNLYETVGDDLLKVRFRSWLPASNGGMLVHYTVERHFSGAPQNVSALNYVARVHYEWTGEPAKFNDRVINPFGFRVTAFDVSLDNPTDVSL